MNGGRIFPIDNGQPAGGEAQVPGTDPHLPRTGVLSEDDPLLLELEAAVEADPEPDEYWPSSGRRIAIAPVLAAIAVVAWSAFFVWANFGAMRAAATAAMWTQWVTAWSMPVLLCLMVMLLSLRLSRHETPRFQEASRLLGLEAERLEKRLVSVNTELALARDFVAAQSRDLESLGRVAVDRLSGSAARLAELIANNGAEVERLGVVSTNALDNMEKLRGHLPVLTSAAKDTTNEIARAGRTSSLQVENLVAAFQRLNEFGQASERQVEAVRSQVDAALTAFTDASQGLGKTAEATFAALASEGRVFRDELDRDGAAAFDAIRTRAEMLASQLQTHRLAADEAESTALAALGQRVEMLRETMDSSVADASERLATFEDAARSLASRIDIEARQLDEELSRRRASAEAAASEQREALARRLADIDEAIGERRANMAHAGAEAAEALAAKLAELDLAIEAQRRQQAAHALELALHCDTVSARVGEFSGALRASSEQGEATANVVDSALATLNARLAETRNALSGTDLQIGELSESAARLLELIEAGAERTRTQLPAAMRTTEAELGQIEGRVFMLRDTLSAADESGRLLVDHVSSTQEGLHQAMATVGRMHDDFSVRADEHQAKLAALRTQLETARESGEALGTEIEARLAGAITRLTEAATQAGSSLQGAAAEEINALAQALGERSTAAIARVLQGRGAELVARLEEAIDTAAAASHETAVQMRDQLAMVDELARNLEARVAQVRERAEEKVDNDFARRVALITESLNSAAIDIAKTLSVDVSETAWASYLRGDRGIFTRRAVSLLDGSEARAVQQHYESDRDFREHVNRYIHDFEGMLRQLLSTREGNVLGVTLLSSDMGKLYVALAQGIERLRA